MLFGVSCDPRAGAVPYGSESAFRLYPDEMRPQEHCNDCWCPVGGFHHPGCDVEQCPHGQLIGCEQCMDKP